MSKTLKITKIIEWPHRRSGDGDFKALEVTRAEFERIIGELFISSHATARREDDFIFYKKYMRADFQEGEMKVIITVESWDFE
jgi:hypothetical protein